MPICTVNILSNRHDYSLQGGLVMVRLLVFLAIVFSFAFGAFAASFSNSSIIDTVKQVSSYFKDPDIKEIANQLDLSQTVANDPVVAYNTVMKKLSTGTNKLEKTFDKEQLAVFRKIRPGIIEMIRTGFAVKIVTMAVDPKKVLKLEPMMPRDSIVLEKDTIKFFDEINVFKSLYVTEDDWAQDGEDIKIGPDGLALIELFTALAWQKLGNKDLAKVFIKRSTENLEKIESAEDRFNASLMVGISVGLVWPESGGNILSIALLATKENPDKNNQIEQLKTLENGLNFINLVKLGLLSSTINTDNLVSNIFSNIKAPDAKIGPAKVKELMPKLLEMAESDDETDVQMALITLLLFTRHDLKVESGQVIKILLANKVVNENDEKFVWVTYASLAIDETLGQKSLEGFAEVATFEQIRQLLMIIATVSQNYQMPDKAVSWLEKKISEKEFMGEQAILTQALSFACQGKTADLFLKKSDKILKDYLAGPCTDIDSVEIITDMAVDAACFDSARAKKFVIQLNKITSEWSEDDRYRLSLDLVERLEVRLSSEVQYRDETIIKLNSLLRLMGN